MDGTETLRVEKTDRLSEEQNGAVPPLVDAAAERDGVNPLSEHVLLHLRYGGDAPVTHLLGVSGDRLAGYAHLDITDEVEGASAELVVHPDARNHGVGSALVRALTEAV